MDLSYQDRKATSYLSNSQANLSSFSWALLTALSKPALFRGGGGRVDKTAYVDLETNVGLE